MERLLLVHDVLDMQLTDPREDKIGRVDNLVLEHTAGQPLRVKSILVGGPARRERIGHWANRLAQLLRRGPDNSKSGRGEIAFSRVQRIGDVIVVNVDEKTLSSEHVERWLCEHIVRRIPGATGDRK